MTHAPDDADQPDGGGRVEPPGEGTGHEATAADHAAAGATGSAGGRHARRRHPKHEEKETPVSAARWLAETVLILVVAVVVALLVRTFVAQPFWIPTESMTHTLEVEDRVLVYQLAYRWSPIERGDVVVFERPRSESANSPKELIKRVVGVEGDTVAQVRGRLTVNGQVPDEPYVNLQSGPGPDFPPTKVPPHHIWVMGDNRGNSSDSRVFGTIDVATVEGRAVARILPVRRIGGL